MTPNARHRLSLAVLRGLVALAAVGCGERPTPFTEQGVVPLQTRWPEVNAAGVISPDRFAAATIETSDGWIILTPIDFSDDVRDPYLVRRMFITPTQARRWAQQVRASLAVTAATASIETDLPTLGRRTAGIEGMRVTGHGRAPRSNISLRFCGQWRNWRDLSDSSLVHVVDLIESAAKLASIPSRTPRPPTLARPYFASEVGCPAVARLENARPVFPDLPAGAPRTPRDVGVRLVVDTSGLVEPHSVEILPDTPDAFADAARRTVARWQFSPSLWGDWPVRQVVHLVLTFDTDTRTTDVFESLGGRPEPRVLFDATPDGWVRVTHGSQDPDGSLKGMREWFTPDTLERWLSSVDSMLAEDAVHPKILHPPSSPAGHWRGYFPIGGALSAVYPGTVFKRDSASRPDTVLRLRAQLVGACNSEIYWGERIDRALLQHVRRAVADARRAGPPLTPSPDRVYDANEVACRARLAKVDVDDPRFPGTSVERFGPYPPSMRAANARSEVMASFIVDPFGRADPTSLVVMSGSDRRAVEALRNGIRDVPFMSPTRGGVRVHQRVIRTFVFTPPPRCASNSAGLRCSRTYSSNLHP